MIDISREEVIKYLSFTDMLKLKASERENILLEIIDDFDDSDLSNHFYNDQLVEYLRISYKGIKNIYLRRKMEQFIPGLKINIIGKEEELNPCFCCGYKTIEFRGEYEICPVCFWEDDGVKLGTAYSNVNHMTLDDAKVNYIKIGAVSDKMKPYVIHDPDVKFNK